VFQHVRHHHHVVGLGGVKVIDGALVHLEPGRAGARDRGGIDLQPFRLESPGLIAAQATALVAADVQESPPPAAPVE
jgi:hypothetical protein